MLAALSGLKKAFQPVGVLPAHNPAEYLDLPDFALFLSLPKFPSSKGNLKSRAASLYFF
jgi:hypothetical protein